MENSGDICNTWLDWIDKELKDTLKLPFTSEKES